MNQRQRAIYEGLSDIGLEISSFYSDAIRIMNDPEIISKSYLLAHLAREIDGGLRDVLAPEKEKNEREIESNLKGQGHLASILTALDLPDNDQFARSYYEVAKKFPAFAHRSGAYKNPREISELRTLWNDYEDILLKLIGTFISQINRIDRLIRYDMPSKGMLATLNNLFRDKQKENHFYMTLKNPNWFNHLYSHGFLSPKTIKDDENWYPLQYIEFLSYETKEGKTSMKIAKALMRLMEEILTYSKEIDYINNYRVRYTFLLVATNIPKECITEKTIELVPDCIQTEYENILESDQIFKFFKSFISESNADKYQIYIDHLVKMIFTITDNERYKDQSSYEKGTIFSIIRPYRLKEGVEDPEFYHALAKYCSNDTLFYIADNLVKYLEESYDNISKGVFTQNKIYRYAYSIKSNFTMILKNVLTEVGVLSPNRLDVILNEFMGERCKKHSQIIAISLLAISNAWDSTKHIFFNYLSDRDENKLFSSYSISDELYLFLEAIAEKLDEDEIFLIKRVVEAGSQDDTFYDDDGKYYDHYRLRWYSALSKNKYIEPVYEELSQKISRTKEDFYPKHKTYITHGSISPLTTEEIKRMPVFELVNFLKSFDPVRDFRSPSVDGLEGCFEEAIKDNPQLFIANSTLFLDVPYRYISKILYALIDLLKKGEDIDLAIVVPFIDKYTSRSVFGSDELALKNTIYAHDSTDVIKSISRLLEKGLRSESSSISKELLPHIFKIISRFSDQYVEKNLSARHQNKLGSATQVINSTTGLIIGSLLSFSLKRAKIIASKENGAKWSLGERKLYESYRDDGVAEFYTLFGWCLKNFFYLDKEWAKELLRSIPNKDLQLRMSYFGGHILDSSSSIFEYNILKPVYMEAIIDDWEIVDDTMGYDLIETHLLIFYISNYEDLEDESLLSIFLKKSGVKSLRGLIHSLSYSFDNYYSKAKIEQKKEFSLKVQRLWNYILDVIDEKEKDSSVGDDFNDFGTLLDLSKYIMVLDNANTNLMIRSSKLASRINYGLVLKRINSLKDCGAKRDSFRFASEIFEAILPKNAYYASAYEGEIRAFIGALYDSGESGLKDKANVICNTLAKRGSYILRDLYEKYAHS